MARFRPILRAHGLTEQQWRILRALVDEDGLDATQLSDRTLISMPSLTRILRGMEAAELLARAASRDDNRRRPVHITIAGKALFRTIAPHSEAAYAGIESVLPDGTLESLYTALDAVSALPVEG